MVAVPVDVVVEVTVAVAVAGAGYVVGRQPWAGPGWDLNQLRCRGKSGFKSASRMVDKATASQSDA